MPEQRRACLLTGATRGIGRAAAPHIAKTGLAMVLVGRDEERGAATVKEVIERSGNENVSFLRADLSSVAEVRNLAQEFRARHDRLDLLLNNAGAIFRKREVTAEGFEKTFALDHLAYFTLTVELLDLLKTSAPARVVNVSSSVYRLGSMHFEDIHLERRYSAWRAYYQAKLANILFTNELARRLEGTGVTANSMHPGLVASGFGRNDGGFIAMLFTLLRPFARNPEKGAETLVHLATSPDVEGVTGAYFRNSRPARISKKASCEESARRLWELSKEMVHSIA